jgi:hypothetical protein
VLDLAGFRTVLAVLLLKGNDPIGSININRQEVPRANLRERSALMRATEAVCAPAHIWQSVPG